MRLFGLSLLAVLTSSCSLAAAQPAAFAAVDQMVRAAQAQDGGKLPMALHVYDRQDRLVHATTLGGFDADKRGPVASASKLVAATVILAVVDQGQLSLDDSTQKVLGWSGERGRITLRQLLGLVSGLNPTVRCTNNADISLAECVDRIRDERSALQHAPGTHFDYGGTTFQVAARMAEVASGQSWQALFAQHLGQPLELPKAVNFYTAPWLGLQRAGNSNPRVGGGLWASLGDYAKLLAVAFHQGQRGPVRFKSAALFDDLASEPQPQASVGNSPMARSAQQPFRYGLGAWLECVPARLACPVVSSPGAFGWTPWYDREAGYYAVIAMFRAPAGGMAGAAGTVDFSVQLEQRLKPLIAQAMKGR